MVDVWPRPERLLPPRLVKAMSAAQAGHPDEALELLRPGDANDELTDDVARLVRGLAAMESGASDKARRLLRPLLREGEPSLALVATLALSDLHLRARRYTSAAPLLARARRQNPEDAARLLLDTALLRLDLLRFGRVEAARVADLPVRLKRHHPAAVHASVHLLRAEEALLLGDLITAAEAERAARPYVHSAQDVRLLRQHRDLVQLLDEIVFADVEDWQRPIRPLSRGEVADLEREPWQLWLDFLHLRVRQRRGDRGDIITLHFADVPLLWRALGAVAQAPRRRLTWIQAQQELALQNEAEIRHLVDRLCLHLQANHCDAIVQRAESGYTMAELRFVHLYRPSRIPDLQQRLLATLAEQPGVRAAELKKRLKTPHRTIVRHLAHLRRSGFVRLVGGGREARYYLV